MWIIIAPDKFKGTLSAIKVCKAIREGITKVDPTIGIAMIPLSDGGEGISEVLTTINEGRYCHTTVHDPLFRQIRAKYGITTDGTSAFIEISKASGLGLLKASERNPLKTTTFGTGELILHALGSDFSKIILGIGGSATNDAGIGMASALGYKFLDKSGKKLKPIGQNLIKIDKIIDSPMKRVIFSKEIVVACDVDIPLSGPNGAAHLFAGQKGANIKDIELLDSGLENFSRIVKKQYQIELSNIKGAGAAGGLGAGTLVFLGAHLYSGINLVLETINFEKRIKKADLIITGEGKVDSQTLHGKVVKGVTDLAVKYNIPVLAFCGQSDLSEHDIKATGLESIYKLYDYPVNMKKAKKESYEKLTEMAYLYIKKWQLVVKS